MFSLLKKLFSRPEPALRMNDSDFGEIQFVEISATDGYWSMDGKWIVPYQEQGIACTEIPGDRSGPAMDAKSFLLSKKCQPDQIWELAEPHLRELMNNWSNFKDMEPRDAFFISCLAKDSNLQDGWEVCFEAVDGLRWIDFCLQIEGASVVSNTIST